MEQRDAVLLEVLARSSQREGFMKMAASPDLVASVRDRFRTAEEALEGCAVSGVYHDRETRAPWQILFFPEIGRAHV